jgi:hypothetical protein
MLKYANTGLYILDLVVQILLEPDKKVPSFHLYHLGFIVGLVEGDLLIWYPSQEVSSLSPMLVPCKPGTPTYRL